MTPLSKNISTLQLFF